MSNAQHPLIKLLYSTLGFLFLLVIMACLFALGSFLYSPPRPAPEQKQQVTADKFTKERRKEIGTGYFHESDQPFFTDEKTAPLCLRCHGNFCHVKSEEFRSYYNMHTFFLACETCHIRNAPGNMLAFKWFDDRTGAPVAELKGKDGNYGAKIVPVREGPAGAERLDAFPEEALALEFLKNKDTYAAGRREDIKKRLMKHISKEPIRCEECHCANGYLNYMSLGYDSIRSSELSRIEIVRLIQQYKGFRFPVMLEPEKK